MKSVTLVLIILLFASIFVRSLPATEALNYILLVSDPNETELHDSFDIDAVYVANDDDYLYFKIQFFEEPLPSVTAGILVELDVDRNRNTGINFPPMDIGGDFVLYIDISENAIQNVGLSKWQDPNFQGIARAHLVGKTVEADVSLEDLGSPTSLDLFVRCNTHEDDQITETPAEYNTDTNFRTISVDGGVSDWSGFSPFLTDQVDLATQMSSVDVTTFFVANDLNYYYFRIDFATDWIATSYDSFISDLFDVIFIYPDYTYSYLRYQYGSAFFFDDEGIWSNSGATGIAQQNHMELRVLRSAVQNPSVLKMSPSSLAQRVDDSPNSGHSTYNAYAGATEDTIEIEIAQFQVERDFDTLLNPGAADPNFKINIIGFDDDFDFTTAPDDDWYVAPEARESFWNVLFYGDYDIDIAEDELYRSYPGPVYIPKERLTLPLDVQIEVWDNDFLIDPPDLMISVNFRIESLPFEQAFWNEGFYMRVVARSLPQIAMEPIPPGNEDLWYFYEVNADHVRNQYTDANFENVRVAIIDTGIDPTVENLGSKIVYWNDLVNGQPDPYDDVGHGTEVASIITGETAGIAENVELIVIKVPDKTPFYGDLLGDITELVNLMAEAINLAINQGADVISISMGIYERSLSQDNINTLQNAVDNAYSGGAIIIAAAGNDRTCAEMYPCYYDNVLSVSALSRFDPDVYQSVWIEPNDDSYLSFASEFSNYGTDYTVHSSSIELSAPGSQIRNFTSYGDLCFGTSFACPIVSGVAALAIGYAEAKYNVVLTPDQVKNILAFSSVDLGMIGWDPYYGYGMVNAHQALQQIDSLYYQVPRTGGPDSFGYTFRDSNSPGEPLYDWIEISGTGTEVLPSSDDQYVENTNLGFFFNYYGTDYSQLAIGNNGLLFSGVGTSQFVNEPITQTSTIHGFIAPLWDDIVTWNTAGTIYYQTIGTFPNRQFVVEWYDNQHYHDSTSGVTFETILYEGTNNILFQYKDVSFGTVTGATSSDYPPYDNGGSATVGIEDPTGAIGLQYSYNEQVIMPGLAILFKFPAFSGTNMHISMKAPSSMDRGNAMTYTLYYNNFGSIAASSVVLEATLSTNVDFVSASDGGTYNPSTRKITWNIGSLPAFPSGRDSRTVTVSIPTSVSIGTVLQTTASISTSTLETRYDDNTASAQTTVTASGLPSGVGVGPTVGTSGGEPSVWWTTPITFTYYSSTATGVDITIHLDDGGPNITGSMTGGPPTWTYTVTFYPRLGHATVTYTVHGPTTTTVNFNIYVDPAGYVYDVYSLERISGATVWLQMPDGAGGWENVPTGAANMQPDTNPLVTNTDGQYQWDTLPGTYRVHVEAAGYYPADSIVVNVPPPVTDLHVGLTLIDNTAPVTSHNYTYLWRNEDFTIFLTATDTGSGVFDTYYRINGGSPQSVSVDGQPRISVESANNTLEYLSVDNAGNIENLKWLVNITLDKTTPTGSIEINTGASSTTSASVTLSLTATDALSGVYQVRFSNDGVWDTETWETPTTSKTWTLTSGDGTKTVYYQIKDNAGLTSQTYSDTITLTTPSTSSGSSSSTTPSPTPSPSPAPSPSPTPAPTPTPSPSLEPSPSPTPPPEETPLFLYAIVVGAIFAAIGAAAFLIRRRK